MEALGKFGITASVFCRYPKWWLLSFPNFAWRNARAMHQAKPAVTLSRVYQDHPFKPLVTTPLRMFFCAKKKTMTMGMM